MGLNIHRRKPTKRLLVPFADHVTVVLAQGLRHFSPRIRVSQRVWLLALLLLLSNFGYGQAQTPTTLFRCTQHAPLKIITTTDSGESVEGPVCAEVTIN